MLPRDTIIAMAKDHGRVASFTPIRSRFVASARRKTCQPSHSIPASFKGFSIWRRFSESRSTGRLFCCPNQQDAFQLGPCSADTGPKILNLSFRSPVLLIVSLHLRHHFSRSIEIQPFGFSFSAAFHFRPACFHRLSRCLRPLFWSHGIASCITTFSP